MKYRTIVADPPWEYRGVPSDPGSRSDGTRGSVESRPFPYPTMTVDQIAAVPVLSLADDHCRLFLWTTSKYLGDAFDVLQRWGFKYIQTVVWKKTGNPSPFGGSVAPNHAEFFLIGKRGAPPLWTRWVSSVIEAPAAQCFDHSRKPDVFQDLVEQVSGGPYLELFARRQRLGWDTWGDEALEHVELAT